VVAVAISSRTAMPSAVPSWAEVADVAVVLWSWLGDHLALDFVNTVRRPNQQWCNPRCGNRARTQRYADRTRLPG
jgi:hypothetical protein